MNNKVDLISYSIIILLVLSSIGLCFFMIIYMDKTKKDYDKQLKRSRDLERHKCVYENDLPSIEDRDKNIEGHYIFTSNSGNKYILDYVGDFYNQVCNTFCDKSDIKTLSDLSGCEKNDYYNRCIDELEPPPGCTNKIPLAYEQNTNYFLFPIENAINK